MLEEKATNESAAHYAPELKERLHALVDVLVDSQSSDRDAVVQNLTASARDLIRRKLSMAGTKSETQRHLEALLSQRITEVFDGLAADGMDGCEALATEVLFGTLTSGAMLSEFADAVDRVILECGSPRDYCFAGRADFIGLEEVLQLLGGANHRGILSLEKPDNRLDLYFDNSAFAFFDPHRFIRRVLPIPDQMAYREITGEQLEIAQQRHENDSVPIVVTLQTEGFFRKGEVRDMMRQLGSEVLYEFIREQADCAYTYRRLDELPSFALEHNLKMPVTPILLEANKQRDDWLALEQVFPNPDEKLTPVGDMISMISSMQLGVLEIKMLSHVSNRATPRSLVGEIGLPLQEIYRYLVRFAKEGVIIPPGGSEESLGNIAMSVEESVEMAWQALDANDDQMEVSSALDKVLGFGEDVDEEDGDSSPPRLLRSVEERDGD